MNAADQLREEGRVEGLEKGRVEGHVEGLERGRADGPRVAIAKVLEARSLHVSEVGRARVASCTDLATLTTWLERAATAASEAEIFAP
jgi:predicted transposase YdaD